MVRPAIPLLIALLLGVVAQALTPTATASTTQGFEVVSVTWVRNSEKVIEIAPGESADLVVVLRYVGEALVTSVTANLTLPDVLHVVGLTNRTVTVGRQCHLTHGATLELRYSNIYISKEAGVGTYNATLVLSYVERHVKAVYEETRDINISVEVSGKPEVGVETLSSKLHVGRDTLRVKVANTGGLPAREVEVVLAPVTGGVWLGNTSIYLGSLDSGAYVEVPVAVETSRNLANTPVRVEVTVSYRSPNYLEYRGSQVIELYVEDPGDPIIDMGVDTASVQSGTAARLNISIANRGPYDIYSASIHLNPQYPLTIQGSRYVSVGDISAGEVRTVSIELRPRSVLNTVNPGINAELRFKDPWGNERSVKGEFTIAVLPREVRHYLNISIAVQPMKTLSNYTIHVSLANEGDETLHNLCISLDSKAPSITILTPYICLEGVLPPHTARVVNVPVVTGSEPGNYTISVTATYMDGEGFSITQKRNFVVELVRAAAVVDVDVTPRALKAGERESITITVTNRGSYTLRDTVVRVGVQGAAFLSESRYYLGDVKPGCNATVRAVLRAPLATSVTSAVLSLTISWRDEAGVSNSDSVSVGLEVAPRSVGEELRVDVEPWEFKALSRDVLKVRVENVGGRALSNVVLSIEKMEPLTPLEALPQLYLGVIEPGEERVIDVPIAIPNTPGIHQIHVSVLYNDADGYSHTYSSRLSIEVEPVRVGMEVEVRPRELASLTEAVLNVGVANTGDVALRDVEVRLQLPEQLVTRNSTTLYIDELLPGSVRVFRLPVLSSYTASTQHLKVGMHVTYMDPLGNSYSDTGTLYITIKPQPPSPGLKVSSEEGELVIGREGRVCINVENPGNHTLKGVVIELYPSQNVRVFGESKSYIGELGPAGSSKICVDVYVPPSVGAASTSLTVKAEYLDVEAGSVVSSSTPIYLLLRGFIEISLTDFAVIPEVPRPGQPFSITVTVTNVGTSTAYAARTVPVLEGLPLKVFGPRSIFIGSVEANAPTTFTLNLMLENTSLRALKVPVSVIYMDNLRAIHNTTLYIPVKVGVMEGAASTVRGRPRGGAALSPYTTPLVIAGIAAVIVVAGVLVYRGRKGRV